MVSVIFSSFQDIFYFAIVLVIVFILMHLGERFKRIEYNILSFLLFFMLTIYSTMVAVENITYATTFDKTFILALWIVFGLTLLYRMFKNA